jgi:tetratricopeptide (TPR) repeat protein
MLRLRPICQRLIAGVLLLCMCGGNALGQPKPPDGDDPRTRQFFEIGQQAYEKSEYLLAIDAFEQAYAIVQRPGLLFSLGQAHQRQFRLKADESQLQAALDAYRRYLAAAPDGRRRGEALAAIESLSSIGKQLHPQGADTPSAPIFGKLLISSPTPGVVVSVGGDRVETLPVALELPNNAYEIVATAPGYEPFRSKLEITAGATVPLNLDLRAVPAKVIIEGPAGSETFVDGQPMGFVPAQSAQLAPGTHWVTVQKAGRRTRSVRVDLVRGESVKVKLELERTAQRSAAWVLGASGLAALLTTGLLVGIAVDRDHSAGALDSRRTHGQLSLAEADQLNSAVDARDRFRTLSIVSGVSTAALFGAALALYFADTPSPPSDHRDSTARRSQRLDVNVAGTPHACVASLMAHF